MAGEFLVEAKGYIHIFPKLISQRTPIGSQSARPLRTYPCRPFARGTTSGAGWYCYSRPTTTTSSNEACLIYMHNMNVSETLSQTLVLHVGRLPAHLPLLEGRAQDARRDALRPRVARIKSGGVPERQQAIQDHHSGGIPV